MRAIIFASVVSCLIVACSSPPETFEQASATLLEGRLLVDGDPTRATPAPGESVTASWLVALGPNAAPVGWAFSACIGRITLDGEGVCSSEPFASGELTPTRSQPSFQFRLPRSARIVPGERLLLAVAECAESTPKGLSPERLTPRCAAPSSASASASLYQLDLADADNHHPRFHATPVSRSGEPWNATVPARDCGDSGLDVLHLGSDPSDAMPAPVPLTIAIDESSRETVEASGEVESLSVLHFSSVGTFARVTTDVDVGASSVVVDWLPPLRFAVPPEGAVAHFGFALLDGRGGADFAERTLCVLP